MSAVVGAIKAITGGGEVEVNRKHIKNISLRLPGKIVMQGNSPFTMVDNSGALMARCIPFRLTKSFVGKEDLTLAGKLKLEYPGIFAWCLEGLRSLYDAGHFTLCESTQSELEQTASWRPRSRPSSRIIARWTPPKRSIARPCSASLSSGWTKRRPVDVERQAVWHGIADCYPGHRPQAPVEREGHPLQRRCNRKDRLRLGFVAAVGLCRHCPEAGTLQSELPFLTQVAAFSTSPPRPGPEPGRGT